MTSEQAQQSVGAPVQTAARLAQDLTHTWMALVQVLATVPMQISVQNLAVATQLLNHTNQALQEGLTSGRRLVEAGLECWQAYMEDLNTLSAVSANAYTKSMANLGPDESFYFRGPAQHLNLPAENLPRFLDAAAQVDDATWLYHLRRGDYARWFREVIQDEVLAAEAEWLAQQTDSTATESRARIRAAIEQRYLWPAQRRFPPGQLR